MLYKIMTLKIRVIIVRNNMSIPMHVYEHMGYK